VAATTTRERATGRISRPAEVFLKERSQVGHEKLPELQEILAQKFLYRDRARRLGAECCVIPNAQIGISRQLPLLQREELAPAFNEYKAATQRSLKVLRTEGDPSRLKGAWAARSL